MRRIGCLIFALCGMLAELQAAVFIPMTIEQMTRQADLVVYGVVQDKQSYRTEDQRLATRSDIKIKEILKGQTKDTLIHVVQGGGTVGDTTLKVSGQVNYEIGAEVVAFLKLNDKGQCVTLGLAQGKFDILTSPGSEQKIAVGLFLGAPPANLAKTKTADNSTNTDKRTLSFEELRLRVKQSVQ